MACPICGNHFVLNEDSNYIFIDSFVCSKSCFFKAMERYENTQNKNVNKM